MDNLTHTLTGLMLSRAGLNRLYARPALVLMVAANMPDIDAVSLVGGPLSYLDHHRGVSHSVFLLPVLAVIPALLAIAVQRSSAGWKAAYILSAIGIASHLLLDWTMVYGVRLLAPVSGEWFHADFSLLYDLWVWAAFLIAIAGPVLGRLVSSEIGAKPSSGKGLAIFALSFFALYDAGRAMLHSQALAVLDSRIYDGTAPLRTAAFAASANPMRWTGWVETSEASIRFDVNLAGDFDPAAGNRYYKPEAGPAIAAAKTTRAFQVLGRFAVYPLWIAAPADEPEGATRVTLRDERFPFTAEAIVDRSHRVVASSFHF